MVTRKKEKQERAIQKSLGIKEKARARSVGQRMKDTIYTSHIIPKDYQHKTSYTKREKKQLQKLEKKMRK